MPIGAETPCAPPEKLVIETFSFRPPPVLCVCLCLPPSLNGGVSWTPPGGLVQLQELNLFIQLNTAQHIKPAPTGLAELKSSTTFNDATYYY